MVEIATPTNSAPYRFNSTYFTIAMRVISRVVLTIGAKKFLEGVVAQSPEEPLYIDFDMYLEEMLVKSGYLLSREAQ